jgi:hypothetical protein
MFGKGSESAITEPLLLSDKSKSKSDKSEQQVEIYHCRDNCINCLAQSTKVHLLVKQSIDTFNNKRLT